MNEMELRQVRQDYSRMGYAYLTFFIVASACQFGVSWLLRGYRGAMGETLYLTVCMLAMYPLAFPLSYLVVRTVPKRGPAWQFPAGGPRFAAIFIVCLGSMMVGNLIGQFLMMFVQMTTGRVMTNVVQDVILEMDVWGVTVTAVIIGPILEEFLFRKFLLDRVSCYGQLTAVLMSGALFAVAHGNFFQFFYAFALGVIFAYVYLRTGRIRYTIILHMLVNFCGSVLPILMLNYMEKDMVTGAYIVLGWYLMMFLSIIGGIIILVLGRRQIWFYRRPGRVSGGSWFLTVCFNTGIVLFFVYNMTNFMAM